MKNIHLLETIKVSKLHFDDKLFLSTNYQLSKGINSIVEGRNIYITNLEKTKLGEWVIYTNGIKIHCQKLDNKEDVELANIENSGVLKIILTTDADLIKDGVQAIDDEFLEWFVKNPSCESVEVINEQYTQNYHKDIWYNRYKIIIPKEEPNQDIIMELQKDPLLKDFDNQVNKKISFLKQKQETLEGVAEKSAIEHFEKGNSYYILGFENGAKYQLEQSFKLMSEYANYYEQCYSERPTKTPLQPSLWFEKFKNK